MSTETKQFPTLHFASAATGVGLCEGISFGSMSEIYEYVLGHPVWTHELDTIARFRAAAYEQFPDLPTKEDAAANWQAAAERAVENYGEFVVVRAGHGERTTSPIIEAFAAIREALA